MKNRKEIPCTILQPPWRWVPVARLSYGLVRDDWDDNNNTVQDKGIMPYVCWGTPENEKYVLEDRKTLTILQELDARIPLDEAMRLGEMLVATGA